MANLQLVDLQHNKEEWRSKLNFSLGLGKSRLCLLIKFLQGFALIYIAAKPVSRNGLYYQCKTGTSNLIVENCMTRAKQEKNGTLATSQD